MAKIDGTHTCKHCSHEFKWDAYLGRHKLSDRGLPEVEDYPLKDVIKSEVYYPEGGGVMFIKCCCPKCGSPLLFKPAFD